MEYKPEEKSLKEVNDLLNTGHYVCIWDYGAIDCPDCGEVTDLEYIIFDQDGATEINGECENCCAALFTENPDGIGDFYSNFKHLCDDDVIVVSVVSD